MEAEQVTLATLRGGAAVEMFNFELQRVFDNILDPNTTLMTREITLKVKIKPHDSRETTTVEISCGSKLASSVPAKSQFYLGKDRGKAVAYEYNPEQLRLSLEQSNAPGVKGVVSGKAVNEQ